MHKLAAQEAATVGEQLFLTPSPVTLGGLSSVLGHSVLLCLRHALPQACRRDQEGWLANMPAELPADVAYTGAR